MTLNSWVTAKLFANAHQNILVFAKNTLHFPPDSADAPFCGGGLLQIKGLPYSNKLKLAYSRLMKNKSNYAFIDSQNLNLAIKQLGWKIDMNRFLSI